MLVLTWKQVRRSMRRPTNRRRVRFCKARMPRSHMLPIGRPGIRVSCCIEHLTLRPHCYLVAGLLSHLRMRLGANQLEPEREV